MKSLRILSRWVVALALLSGAYQFVNAKSADPGLTATWLWTHGHVPPQLSEIPAFDERTNTIWVVGVVGVDVLDAHTGALVDHIDVTADGSVNSVAIRNGLAALAIEAPSQSAACPSCDRRTPGKVLFYDTKTRELADGVNEIGVGSLPDMLTFTHDGTKLLVANEGTPNVAADTPYLAVDPPGSVSIIDMETRTLVATALLSGTPTSGSNLRLPASTGMDFEPEYIAVSHDSTTAYVSVQEANAIGVLDLVTNQFTDLIGLGAKSFNDALKEIDPRDNNAVLFQSFPTVKGLYMPDSVATYEYRGETLLVMANEGDFREDNNDRSPASMFGSVNPLDRLRVSNRDSSVGNLFAAGARSFSIRRTNGDIVYDSGDILDKQAHARLLYDDSRSRDKGVEPEGVALIKIGKYTFAFIGLERALDSAVAVFDITNPAKSRFLDMIVTDGDLGPEGLDVYKYKGQYYLAISNEVVALDGTTSNTTLYRLDLGETQRYED
jgi:DNA-binding beta-propeller fold protein YncE